ncbi:hypothetical protein BN2497_8657 [Janthinobacterium sp. CG23_2]|nr:hypothetical protein BN2497_8657 [Janthinobacterium sp. CG23_2]CUU30726.1 hypothetical protein BN3177_8657 [Janthinobacterium sp. CG23_2]
MRWQRPRPQPTRGAQAQHLAVANGKRYENALAQVWNAKQFRAGWA